MQKVTFLSISVGGCCSMRQRVGRRRWLQVAVWRRSCDGAAVKLGRCETFVLHGRRSPQPIRTCLYIVTPNVQPAFASPLCCSILDVSQGSLCRHPAVQPSVPFPSPHGCPVGLESRPDALCCWGLFAQLSHRIMTTPLSWLDERKEKKNANS